MILTPEYTASYSCPFTKYIPHAREAIRAAKSLDHCFYASVHDNRFECAQGHSGACVFLPSEDDKTLV